MQGFLFGRFVREYFLKLLRSVMNDIKHIFIDTVSVERILQWRATVQELIKGWVCCGVSVGSPMRDCSSLLHEEGSACCGHYRCLHQEFEEGGGRLKGTS